MTFPSQEFLMITTVNGWMHLNLFNKLLWNGLVVSQIFSVINNAAMNDYVPISLYIFNFFPYKSKEGGFDGWIWGVNKNSS